MNFITLLYFASAIFPGAISKNKSKECKGVSEDRWDLVLDFPSSNHGSVLKSQAAAQPHLAYRCNFQQGWIRLPGHCGSGAKSLKFSRFSLEMDFASSKFSPRKER